MNKKNLKIISFRMNKPDALEIKKLLKNKSLIMSNVYRAFTLALLKDTERVLDFLEQV